MAVPVWVAIDDNQVPVLLPSQNAASPGRITPLLLEYLNEGGANFIFTVTTATASDELPPTLQRRLLRLRKDRSHAQSTVRQLESLHAFFTPLFPSEHLIQHDSIAIGQGLAQSINNALAATVRSPKRLNDRLPEEETHAVLVTDMRSLRPGENGLHFKPKWLMQSPDAPPNAVRCRTCALRAWRAARGAKTATDLQEMCPLDLISNSRQTRLGAAESLTDDPRLISWLVDGSDHLLGTLRQWQNHFGRSGFLTQETTTSVADVQNLCKAMTLRDCTLYLLVNESGENVDARLGDLDFKQPEKLAKWGEIERTLIDGGWYTNTESVSYLKLESVCSLSRQ